MKLSARKNQRRCAGGCAHPPCRSRGAGTGRAWQRGTGDAPGSWLQSVGRARAASHGHPHRRAEGPSCSSQSHRRPSPPRCPPRDPAPADAAREPRAGPALSPASLASHGTEVLGPAVSPGLRWLREPFALGKSSGKKRSYSQPSHPLSQASSTQKPGPRTAPLWPSSPSSQPPLALVFTLIHRISQPLSAQQTPYIKKNRKKQQWGEGR